jgi:ATP-dependent protease ClpP protease subunit
MNGLNIYNVLIGLPFELITHNVGNVDSIGNAIFLAGSKRYACHTPHSCFTEWVLTYPVNHA